MTHEEVNPKEVLENIVKKLERYNGFTFFNESEIFCEYFEGKPYDAVQVHDMAPIGSEEDIMGFVGHFAWDGRELKPLDGDSYIMGMPIWGYEEFDFEEDGITKKGLDILAEEW